MQHQLPAISRIEELKREVEAIARIPRADAKTALEYVMRLIGCFPNQGNMSDASAKIFIQALVDLCVGVQISTLQQMVDAKSGLVSECGNFIPSLTQVRAFIERREELLRKRIGYKVGEIEQLESRTEEVTPEERAKRADMLQAVAKDIRNEGRPDWRSEPMQAAKALPGQVHNPEALLASLDNLEAT
jgi:hypothetical protein